MPIIDCGIPQDPSDPAYTEGLEAEVFIKDRTGQPYLGVVSKSHMGYRVLLVQVWNALAVLVCMRQWHITCSSTTSAMQT